jgi:hypothetical protein
MIRALSILGLLLAVAMPLLDYLVLRPRREATGATTAMRKAEWLIQAGFLAALVGMALSGVVPLAFGERMHGWLLMLHMAVAPLFSVCIAALALLWSAQARLTRRGGGAATERATEPALEAVMRWLVMAIGLVTILSALLGMMSWFASDRQEVLLNVHRISALLLTVAAAHQAGRLLAATGAASRIAAGPDRRQPAS